MGGYCYPFHGLDFSLEDIEKQFLNQIRGTSIGNNPICSTCMSEIDGGVQCSLNEPDVFQPQDPVPIMPSKISKIDFNSIQISNERMDFTNTYMKDLKRKRCLRFTKLKI